MSSGPPVEAVPSPPPFTQQQSIQKVVNEEWKSFSLPAVSTLALIDLKSQKPALKHLRKQFCLSLVQDNGADCSVSPNTSELSDVESNDEQDPSEADSPMEVKNYFPSPFVRHGFGRVSCTTTSSSYQSSDNLNCIEEMEASDNANVTSVQRCISKFNGDKITTTVTTSKCHIGEDVFMMALKNDRFYFYYSSINKVNSGLF